MEKTNKGGRREGAGRPKKGLKQVCIYIPEKVHGIIKTRAEFERLTLGEYIQKHLTL